MTLIKKVKINNEIEIKLLPSLDMDININGGTIYLSVLSNTWKVFLKMLPVEEIDNFIKELIKNNSLLKVVKVFHVYHGMKLAECSREITKIRKKLLLEM